VELALIGFQQGQHGDIPQWRGLSMDDPKSASKYRAFYFKLDGSQQQQPQAVCADHHSLAEVRLHDGGRGASLGNLTLVTVKAAAQEAGENADVPSSSWKDVCSKTLKEFFAQVPKLANVLDKGETFKDRQESICDEGSIMGDEATGVMETCKKRGPWVQLAGVMETLKEGFRKATSCLAAVVLKGYCWVQNMCDEALQLTARKAVEKRGRMQVDLETCKDDLPPQALQRDATKCVRTRIKGHKCEVKNTCDFPAKVICDEDKPTGFGKFKAKGTKLLGKSACSCPRFTALRVSDGPFP